MDQFKRWLFVVGLVVFIGLLPSIPNASAQTTVTGPTPTPPSTNGIVIPNSDFGNRVIYPGNFPVNVSAQVGGFVVNISGFASPNGSIVLKDANQNFLGSTVADSKGDFVFNQVAVKKDTAGFCFETVDFKRLGDTAACLSVTPISESRDFTDVFLPPTLGVFKKQINAGQEALMYGYSMPKAGVNVNLSGKNQPATADAGGYYEYRIKNAAAGDYVVSSTATLNNAQSLPPNKQKELKVLSLSQQVANTAGGAINKTKTALTNTLLGFVVFIFLLFLVIIALLLLIFKPAFIAPFLDRFKKSNPLHHDWLLTFEANYGI